MWQIEKVRSTDELLDGLSPAQSRAVTTDAAPLCIIAGAGSGKTRVLTRRIAYRASTETLDPNHTLVLTFTRKAAGELRSRLRNLEIREGLAAGTFHSVAYAQLRARWTEKGMAAPKLLNKPLAVFARHLPRLPQPVLFDAMNELNWSRSRAIASSDYAAAAEAAGRRAPIALDRLTNAFDAYAADKKKRRLIDFDDLLELALRDLTSDAKYADTRRWKYRHLFVDEFQDVNPLQHKLLEAWRGDRPDLCVVGDPDQAIYAWNGAEANFIRNFDRHHDGTTVRLGTNYRSTPQILRRAERVLLPIDANRIPASAFQPEGASPLDYAHADDRAEAAAIARLVRDGHPPGSLWSQQAILVRTNAQTALIQEALGKAGIPYRVRGGRAFLEHPTVASAIDMLQKSDVRLSTAIIDLRDLIDSNPSGPAAIDAAQHLDTLVRLASDQLDIDTRTSAAEFVELIESLIGGDSVGVRSDSVDISTFHAAKGLEWPTVHLAGLEAGYVPIAAATSAAARDEERRLLYVAMTRARETLTLHWAKKRTFNDRKSERAKSPFLAGFADVDPSEDHSEDPPSRPSQELREQHQSLQRPVIDMGSTLLTALYQWRADAARGANVAPEAVVGDEVLDAVAHTRPSTDEELAELACLSAIRRLRHGPKLLDIVAQS